MPDEVTLNVTTIAEAVTVETTAGDVAEIKVVAQTGPTGPAGPAGPNSVTSATTSDGTADLDVATITGGGSGLTGLVSAQITDATNDTQANPDKLIKSNSSGSVKIDNLELGSRSDSNGHTLRFLFAPTPSDDDFGVDSIFLIKPPYAGGVVALTSSNNGQPDKLTNGTIAGTLTINSTSYTYGVGAAAAHRTALGLGTIATQNADNVSITGGAAAFTANSSVTGYLTAQLSGSTTGKVLLGAVTGIGRDYPGVWFGTSTTAPATNNYALLFDSTAGTIFNSPPGLSIFFRIGNTNAITVDSTLGVGIGTTTPSAKALLDLTSTTRGFLPPRMTTTQRDAITSVPAGLMIYNTTTNKLNVFTTVWEQVTSA